MRKNSLKLFLLMAMLPPFSVAVHADGSAGIWKAFVPRGVTGEFDSHDPIGLIAGKRIRADCSLNWRDQDGLLYCFSSATSLVYFLDMPGTNLRRARKAWQAADAP